MATLLIAIGALVGYFVAYHTYGRWLSRKIFKLKPDASVPSVELNDNRDYVPTTKAIVFGHHFTSIAGTGPIVGPAIAVIWGWLPALLWVFFGSILIGAVHDFGALVLSLRNRGQTVGDVAGRVLNKRVRLMFLLVLFMALTIVLAIFGLVIAAVFRQYPSAIFPCVVQIPIAMLIGIWLHRKGVNLTIPSVLALAVMYMTVIYGDWGFLGAFNAELATWPTMTWVVALLGYSYVASVLPVWMLLQPRDYINSLQLLTALGLVVVGLCAAAFFGGAPPVEGAERQPLEIVAPMIRFDPAQAPLIFPFLFITIACGAISGFHCLVSSGTTSKQLSCETDAQFVGYGSMLTEGFLATIVILACVAGLGLGVVHSYPLTFYGEGGQMETMVEWELLTGSAAYEMRYSSWSSAGALGTKVAAFVDGAANFLKSLGIAGGIATALMGVLVASFAGTTLDTACRLQRYVIQELAATFLPRVSLSACAACGYDLRFNESGVCSECGADAKEMNGGTDVPPVPHAPGNSPLWEFLTNKHTATIFAVIIAILVALIPASGKTWSWANGGTGGMLLWPMFGATNQLLGGLTFLVIGFWLWRRKLPVWFIIPPMLFMLIMPCWALVWQLFVSNGEAPSWFAQDNPNWVLIIVALATLALELWMIIEAVLLWPRVNGRLEDVHDSRA